MNRRTSIKQIFVVGALGVSTLSVFKWFQANSVVKAESFDHYKNLLAELAETIIPKTDTPGAKDAQVEVFIIKMMQFCEDRKTQHNFLNGLHSLETYTFSKYDHDFIRCNKSQRAQVLAYFEEKSYYSINILNKINYKLLGSPFFTKLKELTVQGYCTSQIGATNGLAYDYIPGTYEACIPLSKNQRSWATK